ncbi:hypothetical protein [Pseudomonas sp. EA_35y_Pfl2_R5]|uniref:hypothetical protein n=1 Tax=Pseudomonas sp. EA_35y_Pfl2_R5 TaxID=3088690 RepID=UPI0030DAD96A
MQANDERSFKDFLSAVKSADMAQGITEAACHHSAVEVNDWEKISQELRNLSENKKP